jgi:hypothetical protein
VDAFELLANLLDNFSEQEVELEEDVEKNMTGK